MTLNQIKQEIAALLNVDSVNAKSLFELANSNSVVLTAIQSIDASQFNLRTTETWQAILNKLKGEGVKEDLSSCAGGVTGNTLKSSEVNSNDINSTKGQEYKLFLPEVIQAIIDKLDDNNTYKVDRGSGHTPVVYHLCIDNKDGQTKLLVIIGSWLALSTIQMYYRNNLISKAIKPDVTSAIVTTETNDNKFKGIPIEHVACDDIGLDYPETTSEVVITMHQMPTVTYFLVANSDDVLQFNSLDNAVKKAKQWLATESEQINQAIANNVPHQYAAVLGGNTEVKDVSQEPLPDYGDVVVMEEPEVYCTLDAAVVDEGYSKELHIRSTKHCCGNQHSTIATAKLEHLNKAELIKIIKQLEQIRDSM